MDIPFRSPEHQQRFAEALRLVEEVYDNGYGAALYILTADFATWEKAKGYVSNNGIPFPKLLEQEGWGAAYSVLIRLAGNLFNADDTHMDPAELLRLDDKNFRLALDAIKLRRYGLNRDNIK